MCTADTESLNVNADLNLTPVSSALQSPVQLAQGGTAARDSAESAQQSESTVEETCAGLSPATPVIRLRVPCNGLSGLRLAWR